MQDRGILGKGTAEDRQNLRPLRLGQPLGRGRQGEGEAQQGAAGNLYQAGNTNAGILAGMTQQKLSNQGQGVTAAGAANEAANAGPNAILAAEAARKGIPLQQLSLLASIGVPIAGLGSQSSGTSTGTKQDSGWTQFGQAANGTSNLFKSFFPGGL